MGNKLKLDSNNNDQFIKAVNELKKSKNQSPIQKVATHLEQRYKNHLIQTLRKQQMPKNVKRMLYDCIQNKIKKQDLTSTISVLNSLRSNNADQLLKSTTSNVKWHGQSKNVVIKFDDKKFKNSITARQSNQLLSYGHKEDTIEGRIKHTGNFICKQLNKPYHPFRPLCKRFTDILYSFLQQNQAASKNQKQYEKREQLMRKTIKQFCLYMVNGCAGIYKKWIIDYTSLQQKKYDKWMFTLILNEIWYTNEGYMLNIVLQIIKIIRVPLKVNIQALSVCSSKGFLQPNQFAIDQKLQIQGHYFNAIFEMSCISQKKKPTYMLKQLENIKNSVCIDIDNYHKLCQKGQIYQVNGDNIMGIVAYVLSKISTKIQEISDTLLFLKLIYGDGIFYNMDTSSYMYSTIWGAIEYLQSKKFQVPSQNAVQQPLKNVDDTNGTQSFGNYNDS